ncbi:Alcohol dehydrogenase GroES-like domain-containing protein [Cladophialophora immunda]|nr:Alcohol dehydrogenase GroES-like domain-containing protein [Cladophialophora immunda]
MPSAWQIAPSEPKDWRTTDGIENLRLVQDLPKPRPEPGTALVWIKAAALNARDMMVIAHDPIYPIKTQPYLVPCADGAGVVEEVGLGSTWKPGDRVLLTAMRWIDGDVPTLVESQGLGAGSIQGTLQEYLVVADNRLIRAPAHLTFAEMAALPAAAGTATNALFYGPQPFRPGMTVLTQGTGGVSACAIQIAAAAGATVVATSSSDEKLKTAKALGATHLINYTEHPVWSEEVLRVTDGKGVDHVLDVAGAGTIEQSLLAAKHGGLVSVIGFLSDSQPTDIIPPLLFGAKTMRAIFQVRNDMAQKMARLYEEHQLRPPIAAVYKWEEAKEAFKALNAHSAIGKIVVEVGPS